MNYKKSYDALMNKATERGSFEGYGEIHHIIPRSLGGKDLKENLVKLTAKEHFIAHRLLAKIYPNSGLVYAIYMMANFKRTEKITSRLYEFLKKDYCRILESQEEKDKRSNPGEKNGMFGKTHNEEARQRIREAQSQKVKCNYCDKEGTVSIMGRWHFEKCKLSPNYVPPEKMKRMSPTEETRLKIKEGNLKSKDKSKGWINPNKGKPQKKGCICPHCNMECGSGQYTRWHGDNCKLSPTKREGIDPTQN